MTISDQTFISPSAEHKQSDVIAEVNAPEKTLFVSLRVEKETERLCQKT